MYEGLSREMRGKVRRARGRERAVPDTGRVARALGMPERERRLHADGPNAPGDDAGSGGTMAARRTHRRNRRECFQRRLYTERCACGEGVDLRDRWVFFGWRSDVWERHTRVKQNRGARFYSISCGEPGQAEEGEVSERAGEDAKLPKRPRGIDRGLRKLFLAEGELL